MVPTRVGPADSAVAWWIPGLDAAERVGSLRSEPVTGDSLPPTWVRFVTAAVDSPPDRAADRPADDPDVRASGGWRRAFAHILGGVVAAAYDRVRPALDELDLAGVLDASGIAVSFRRRLGHHLAALAGPTLVSELHRCRDAGLLNGAGPAERFQDFVRILAEPDRLASLLHAYPVLARALAQRSMWAADTVVELVRRLCADRAAIVATLFGGVDPGRLTEIETGLGDAHQGGRSTSLLRFEHGQTLIYKPRPLDAHLHFAGLVAWLNSRLATCGLRTVPALGRPGYGWLGHVPHRPCRTGEEVRRFYYRHGVLMALLHAVDATDIHYENVVADGDQPMIVDVETLFHPTLSHKAALRDPAARALESSLLRLAVLPQLVEGDYGVADISAVGGEPGSANPFGVVSWADEGTDRMRMVIGPGTIEAAANRPRLGDRDMDAVDHERAMMAGFRAGYATICRYRSQLLLLAGRFANDEIRVITQPTWLYAIVLREAGHPEALVDTVRRDRVFDLIREAFPHDQLRRALFPHEVNDLSAGDTPLFTSRPGSTDLCTASGVRLRNMLPVTGLAATANKIAAMGPVDRRRQEWLITSTLAVRRARRGGPDLSVTSPRSDGSYDPRLLLSRARTIGDDLVDRAIRTGDDANWLTLDLSEGAGWRVCAMGADLAAGYTGTALFLAQLATVLDQPRYADTARCATGQICAVLEHISGRPDLIAAVGCGGFDGFGGIAYATARLTTLLGDPMLARASAAAVELAARATALPGPVDLASGTAGCLAAMLAVCAESGLPAAATVARECADQLIGLVMAPGGPGFPEQASDGQRTADRAGVALALLRAGEWFADEACTAAGLRALAQVDHRDPRARASWCDGSAGVLMAYARAPFAAEQNASAATILAHLTDRPIGRDLSPCHGELGIVEALMLHDRAETHIATAWRERAACIAARFSPRTPACATPGGVPTPGLLRGLAGIGYQFLRIGHPRQVPSLLMLDPTPSTGRASTHTSPTERSTTPSRRTCE